MPTDIFFIKDNFKTILTCEHGGNEIPLSYSGYYKSHSQLLNSHRGWDPGALSLAKSFHQHLRHPLFSANISRLLVELNRSLHHPNLFSGISKAFTKEAKKDIIENYYFPYRLQVENHILNAVQGQKGILHISVHSFTPVLNGITRDCDIGLLYDPSRANEKLLASVWKHEIKKQAPQLRVRFNYPYKGKADGFTSYLRKRFENVVYAGIELEVNQALLVNEKDSGVAKILINSLKRIT